MDEVEQRRSAVVAAPPRRRVASYSHYVDAERAVDWLSDQGFPVESVAIVGDGLRYVEQVTRRRTYVQAIGGAALSGAAVGAFFGLIFAIFGWIDPVVAGAAFTLYLVVLGAFIGALTGLVVKLASRGRRDFDSNVALRAGRYDVMVDADLADRATRLLDELDPAA